MSYLRKRWLLFFLALVSNVCFQLTNRAVIGQDNPHLLREGITVYTSDDASYLAPAENWLAGKGWQSNAVGVAAKVTRSPGYGAIYAMFRWFSSEKTALILLVLLQFLLFALAASMVPAIGRMIGLSEQLSFMIGLFIAVWPMFSNFMMYSLTEGLTPSLVLLFLYLFLSWFHDKGLPIYWSALVLALIVFIRPPLIVLVLCYPLVSMSQHITLSKIAMACAIVLLPIGVWVAYTSSVTGENPSLHPIYHADANDLYRPVHADIWAFHKTWGQTGVEFHTAINGLWNAAQNRGDGISEIEIVMEGIPSKVKSQIGDARLAAAYGQYFEQLAFQVPYFESGKTIEGVQPLEVELTMEFQAFRVEAIAAQPIYSWVGVPLNVYWRLGAHSNMSLYIFQATWRGKWWMEAMRLLSFLIHLSTFILFPIALILLRKNKTLLVLGLPILLYLLYLCIVQRGVEERYTLPFLIPMLIMVAAGIERYFVILRKRIKINE